MSLISISHLTFAYDGCFDNVFEDVSLRLDTDWKLGLTGRNGRGKTTLLKLLLGRYEYTGTISASVEFEYFPYDVPDKNRRSFVAAQSSRMQQRRKNLERRQQAAIEEKAALLKDIESAEALKLCGLNYRGGRLIALRDVGVAYGKTPICTGVTFTIEPGDRVALCGKNGSGKSSVLRLICGEAVPHTGTVETGSRLKLSCVPQDASALCGDLREYARQAGIDESLFKTILRKLDFSRVQFEKDMADFSAGQRKKVLLARSLCEQAHLYVWDEPMNYIDVISRIQIETLLLDFRPTILFVEHDRAFCEKIATKTVRL